MIRLFQRLLLFSGLQKKRLIRSFLAYLVSSFFEMIPIMAILTVLTGILKQLSGDVMPESTIWISLGIMIVSIVGRIVFVNLSANARTLGSFAFGSEKRIEIGERLKRAPMGYFNENRLGDITAAVTTTLGDLEQLSVTIMENVAGGFIHAIVIGVWLMIYEWRIGLISLAGLAVALIVYSLIGKVGRKYAPRRQAAQAGLVTAVLEYVQGMGVVKAFGLAERTGKAVDAAIEESKEANIVLEKAFSKNDGALSDGVQARTGGYSGFCALSFGRRKHHAGEVPASSRVQLHDLCRRGSGGQYVLHCPRGGGFPGPAG